MRKQLSLCAFACLFLCVVACNTVKKTAHSEKTSENIIANTSQAKTAVSNTDSTGKSETVYDFEEKTTIEVGDTSYRFPVISYDSMVPRSFPSGTRIVIERKGRIKNTDTSSIKRNVKNFDTSSATNQVIKSFEQKDSTKHTSRFPISVVIAAVVLILIVIAFLYSKKETPNFKF